MSYPEAVPLQVRLAARGWASDRDLAFLFVPYELGQSSANRTRGRHWGTQQKAAETAHLAAMWAYREAGDPVFREPLTVDLLVFRERTMDDDNVKSGLKAVRDWLFKRRLAPDDDPRWVVYGACRQITGAQWAKSNAWVVFLVRRRTT